MDLRQDPLVEFVEIESFNDALSINVTGVTVPFREITIAAEVAGAITDKSDQCQEGKYVDEGTPLLSIDSKKYLLRKQRLDAEVKEAQARMEKVKAEKDSADAILTTIAEDFRTQNAEYEKRLKLAQFNAISETELAQSKRTKLAAENAKLTQEGKVATLEADLKVQEQLIELKKFQRDEADYDLKKAEIKAPSKGVIISDDVQEDAFVTVGQKLLVFEDTEYAEVKIDLRADQLQMILENESSSQTNDQFKLPKREAIITYEANDTIYQWEGYLDRYAGLGLNETTRTAPCLITIENTLSKQPKKASTLKPDDSKPKRRLVRGMYVTVELKLEAPKDGQQELMRIPENALQPGNLVWLYLPSGEANGKGILSKRRVEVVSSVIRDKATWYVIKSVSADGPNLVQIGDRIITKPIPQPIDGMPLRGKPEEATGQGNSELDRAGQTQSSTSRESKTSSKSASSEKVSRLETGRNGGVR